MNYAFVRPTVESKLYKMLDALQYESDIFASTWAVTAKQKTAKQAKKELLVGAHDTCIQEFRNMFPMFAEYPVEIKHMPLPHTANDYVLVFKVMIGDNHVNK